VDSLDLLAGIMLADLRDSPARVLLEHFRIPSGEVLSRPDRPRLTPEALLSYTRDLPATPKADPAVSSILDSLSGNESVTLGELFCALLQSKSEAARAIRGALAARGFPPEIVTDTYQKYLKSRRTLRTVLDEDMPYQATNVLLPGFVADQPQQLEDLVGIGPEVDAFAHLIASKRLVPPLAVGMFGDWGSGKSYFLRSLQRRITEVADCRFPAFHESIVQIEFNAWQYVGGDLWAGLIEHLFRNLRVSGDDSDDLLAQRQRFWLQQLQGADEEHQRAQEERVGLEAERKEAATEVETYERKLENAAKALERAQQASPGEALKNALKEAADAAGLADVTQNAAQLTSELQEARNNLRSLLAPIRDGDKRYLIFVLVALVVTPAVTYLAGLVDLSALASTVAWLLGTAATYVATAGKYIRDATERIANAQSKLAEAEQQEHDRIAGEVQAAQQTLAEIQSRLDTAVQREQDLTAGLAEIQRSLDATTPGQVLTDFITERLDSDDYRRHLGVPALVRRDLERLSRLVAAQQPGPYSIDRIVLYIDDLDRCPTPVVIKVLEAVHLLLAFPLFVVVVAVDARWLASSLREHYGQLSGPDATPEDYLEKIFQVPFRIQPLPLRQREQMVRGLLMPSIMQPIAERGHVSEDVWIPETDVEEFTRVVSSFSDTSSTRQALSDAIDLTVTDDELAQAKEVASLIGGTPRAVKRFVNIYLLVKSIGAGRGWHLPHDGALMPLLAVATGLPRLADAIFPALATNGTLPEPSEEDPHYDEYRTFATWLNGRSLEWEGLHEWLDLIHRFRFPEGRAGHETGRMER
jgi:hypothetical protein